MGTRPRAEMSRPRSVRGLTPSTRPPVWHLSQRAWKAPTEKSHIACVSLENNHSRLYKVPGIRTGVWRLLGKWVRERPKCLVRRCAGPPWAICPRICLPRTRLPTDTSATTVDTRAIPQCGPPGVRVCSGHQALEHVAHRPHGMAPDSPQVLPRVGSPHIPGVSVSLRWCRLLSG